MIHALRMLSLALLAAPALAQGGPPPPPPPPPGPVPPVPIPPGNPITPAKALLGKALFWDEQLSASGTMSCGTCHIPSSGGSDPRTFADPLASTHAGLDGAFGTPDDVLGSQGTIRQLAGGEYDPLQPFGLDPQVTPRKAPSMINAAFAPRLPWDGRAGPAFEDPLTGAVVLPLGAALEAQAAEPPLSDVEMSHVGEDWTSVAARISTSAPLRLAHDLPPDLQAAAGQSYPDLFETAFGTQDVTPVRILMAIATYERTLVSNQAPWDAFVAGDPSALTPLQQQGRNVYFGQGRCDLCHGGPLFTDQAFHDTGLRPDAEDFGRGAITGIPLDNGRFKTPSLRDVALRAPFFHDGSQPSLAGVVEFYDRGGDFESDPIVVPLGLTPQQKTALVAFMQALTDPRVATGAAPFDRPGLFTESAQVAQHYGAGSPGSAGIAPEVIAVEPLPIDAASFSIGVKRGRGGAPAFLAFDAQPAAVPFEILGADVHLAITPFLVIVPAGPLDGPPLPGFGHETLSFPVSVAPAQIGAAVYAQWFVLDAGAPQGLAATEGVRVEYF